MRAQTIVGGLAIALQLALALGLAQTVSEIVEVYDTTPIVEDANEEAFKQAVAASLRHVERALPVALGGLALAVIAYMSLKLRARWFFWWWLVASCVWLPIIPFGTLIGLVALGFLILRRREFLTTS